MPTDTKSPIAEAIMHSAGELKYPNLNTYPARIVLTSGAENYLSALAVALVVGTAELWQLSPALNEFYTFAYENGSTSRQAEVDRHRNDADRYYTEMCRRKPVPFIDSNAPTYAELEAIRSDIYGGNK